MFNQNKVSNNLRVAILGASGIGLTHAHIFQTLGAKIESISCSSQNSAKKIKELLSTRYGINTNAYFDVNAALDNALDAVSICTPPEYHYEHILAAFDKGLSVFCEKPLFWDNTCTMKTVQTRIEVLQSYPNCKLFVNTSNTVLLKAIGDNLPLKESVNKFSFIFHTNGSNEFENIAIDLLPHGLSILLYYFGTHKIESFNWKTSKSNFSCNFKYGHSHVKFDFVENPKVKKYLALNINGRLFERIQEGYGSDYKVYMQDVSAGNNFYFDDPFIVYIKRFIEYCQNDGDIEIDYFEEATTNLKLMAFCMEKIIQKKKYHH
jgi:hypothetical protein